MLFCAVSAIVFAATRPAEAQLSGPTRGEGAYFHFGLGPAIVQDFGNSGAVVLPGAQANGGIGVFLGRDLAVGLAVDVTGAWDVRAPATEPNLILSSAQAAVRYYPEPRQGIFALAGLGLAGEGIPGDSADFTGVGATLGLGWDAFDRGFGLHAGYTPRLLALSATPRFAHAVAIGAYVLLGL